MYLFKKEVMKLVRQKVGDKISAIVKIKATAFSYRVATMPLAFHILSRLILVSILHWRHCCPHVKRGSNRIWRGYNTCPELSSWQGIGRN